MKKAINYFLIAIVAVGLSFVSCKKNSSTPIESTADQQQMAADENNHAVETQNSLNEANDAMGTTGFGKTGAVYGATTTIDSNLKKITIVYNGNNKDNSRSRTGQIIIQLTTGAHWKDAGATISLTYIAFKVTNISTGKSITFDGTINITNQTGGRVFIDANVVHLALSTGFIITFDDGTQRTWNLSRKRTFTNTAGVFSVKEEGTGKADGNNNLISWGQNRKGDSFYTQISTPIVYNTIFSSQCPNNIMSGQKIHILPGSTLTVTFGLDGNGNPVSGTNCPTSFMVQWTNSAGQAKSALITY